MKSNGTKCDICGISLNSYYTDWGTDYIFCKKHYDEYKKYLKIFNNSNTSFFIVKNNYDHSEINSEVLNNSNTFPIINSCLICGKESNGYHFCHSCYRTYKNKNIVLRIKNCTSCEVLDTSYENPYTCEDGHPVKSQQEALIDNYLFYHNIRHIYEKPFPIDGNKSHDLHPDFYLPDLDVYIEHWGIKNNKKYEETKEYKIPFYEKAKITLICTDSNDISNISANLERKLKYYEKEKINWFD